MTSEEQRLARNAKARERYHQKRQRQLERQQAAVQRYIWSQAEHLCLTGASFRGEQRYWICGMGHQIIELLVSFMDPEERQKLFQPYLEDPQAGHPQAWWKAEERYQAKRAARAKAKRQETA